MTWHITQQGITGRNNALYDTQDTKEHYRTQQALQDTTGHCRTLPHIIWQNTKGHYSTLQTQYSYLFWSGNFASVKQLLQLFPLCTPAVARRSLVLLSGLLHVAFPLTWLAGLFLLIIAFFITLLLYCSLLCFGHLAAVDTFLRSFCISFLWQCCFSHWASFFFRFPQAYIVLSSIALMPPKYYLALLVHGQCCVIIRLFLKSWPTRGLL